MDFLAPLIFTALNIFILVALTASDMTISPLVYILFLLIITYVCFNSVRRARHPDANLIEVLYQGYMLYILLIPGFVQLSSNEFYWVHQGKYDDTSVLISLIIVFLFYIIIDIFNYQGICRYSSRASEVYYRPYVISNKALAHSAFISIIITIFISVYLMSKVGIANLFGTRGGFEEAVLADMSIADSGIAITAPRLVSLMSIILTGVNLSSRSRHERSNFAYVLFMLALILNLINNNPISLPRGQIITIIVFVYSSLAFSISKIGRLFILLLFPIILYTLFPALSMFNRLSTTSFDFSFILPVEAMRHGDFDSFQSILNVTLFVTERGYNYGLSILSSLLFFVPREIWSSKATPTGPLAAEYMGYQFLNVSSPLPSEFYIDFGLIGVIVFASLYGILMRKTSYLYTCFERQKNVNLLTLFSVIFMGCQVVILRGALMVALSVVSVYLISIAMMVILGLTSAAIFRR